uniref:Growth hormone-regulated TBC protein 1 n=1 Tax=Periophthalmus magnuspinnatus TaxID=409849 RepID=A0A3B4AXM3_9GOBI
AEREDVDPYGFERSEDFDYSSYEELMSVYLAVLTRRSIKWSKLLKGKHRVQKNVKYLNRTFPDNIHFRKSSERSLLASLYNVLRAYGHHNPDVGYCQGMNFIAGYLLLITKDEEKSFWLMDALIGRILPDYYTPVMLGLKTDQEVLGELVRLKAPGVWRTMLDNNVLWSLVVSRWFICLFIDVLPVETVLRIWDCLFYEGSKILFRVALTLIHRHQTEIQTASSLPDVCDVFKRMTRGPFVDESHAFMQRIFTETGSLSRTTLTKLRTKCRAKLTEEES